MFMDIETIKFFKEFLLFNKKKGDFEISELAKLVLIVLSILALMFLIISWVNQGRGINIFRR